ncbi:FIST signal transduction protein [Roseivirga misakiensis]|uniref:Histidine kinase n=1 Tax=Roseivirga misakiensis TaxID=1563681 RepID=A0A1E5SY38_9BACT|nr:FIST N-terminal domain-containing protein [Roseivirga misakiensis]OEK04039.1 hypothetical protein BFP71_11125 [Roseivirga misakiensis]
MIVDQFLVAGNQISYSQKNITGNEQVSFVLVFTSRGNLESADWLPAVEEGYPGTEVISCSTSGEVYFSELTHEAITGMAVSLEKTPFAIHSAKLANKDKSFALGKNLAGKFSKNDLKHVLLFGDGWLVNGSDLVQGMYANLNKDVSISGGLAGDGANFSKTLVGLNDDIDQSMAVAIGFYGDALKVGFGAHGGWSELGETYEITKTEGREILELGELSPLPLYKQFLGDDADGLPGSALLYPVAVWLPGAEDHVVRTVFNTDEFNQSITLGEPTPVGAKLQFMRARFDDLLAGVRGAANEALSNLGKTPEMALMVSCIGRKLLFNQHIDQEIEQTRQVLGSQTPISGFYSYGEICPVEKDLAALHHQMLTLTLFTEA